MAYDEKNQVILLFGGRNSSDRLYSDTWQWDGTKWSQQFPAAQPSARRSHKMVYDPDRKYILLFGGTDHKNNFSDTWAWDGKTWIRLFPKNNPPGRHNHAMAFDLEYHQMIIWGGWSPHYSDTWAWNGNDWKQLFPISRPSARDLHAMATDFTRNRIVLFGGWIGSAPFQDTWEWDGLNWLKRGPTTLPPGRRSHCMVFDKKNNNLFLFGGHSGTSPLADTWKYQTLSLASYTSYGTGCPGSGGSPTLEPGNLPWIGGRYKLKLFNLPVKPSSGLMFIGTSNTTWGGFPLPLDLTPLGMTGCILYTRGTWISGFSNPGGSTTWYTTLPNDSLLVGGVFHNQALVLDPSSPTPGRIITSNAGKGTIGAK